MSISRHSLPSALVALAAVMVLLGTLYFASLRSGYSHISNTISELGETGAPQAHLVAFGFFLPVGLLIWLALWLLHRVTPGKGLWRVLFALSCLGTGYVVSAFFPCDPGAPLLGSWRTLVHNAAGLIDYGGTALGFLLFCRYCARHNMRPQAVTFGIAAALGFLALVLLGLPPAFPVRGVVQRVAELIQFTGVFFVCHLLSTRAAPDKSPALEMLRELTRQNRARLSIVLLWMGFLLPTHLCTAGEAPPSSKPVTLETYLQQLGYGSIPLKRTDQNHLAVDGELAGKKAVFLIDTGNSVTKLDKKIGSRFKTLAERGIKLEDPNLGEFPGTNYVLVDELKLGMARFPNQPANVTALGHQATSAYEISTIAYEDCLIGCDFLLRHHCLLDCAGLKLYVRADKPGTDIRAALESGLRRSGYHETVLIPTRGLVELCPARVNGVALRLLVDSGSIFTFLDDHRGRQSPLAKLRVSSTDRLNQGVGKRGGTPIYVADPESFQLDGIEISLRKIRLGVTDLISFNIGRYGSGLQNVDGILGAEVLAVSGSLVDLENRRLWFLIPKNAASSKPQ